MGNHASSHSSSYGSPSLDMNALGERTQLTKAEIKETFVKFQQASKGGDSISRRKFSNIMHQCFPRTHKVTRGSFYIKDIVTSQLHCRLN